MDELSKAEFCRVYESVAGDEHVNFQQLSQVVALTGKPIFTAKIQRMWPENQEFISKNQAYSLYSRYEPPSIIDAINEDEVDKIDSCTADGILYFLERKRFPFIEEACSVLEDFVREDGTMRMKELLQHIEETRRKRISEIRGPTVSRHKSSFIRKQSLMHNDSLEKESICKVRRLKYRLGGFLVVSPHMAQVQHWMKAEEDNTECRIGLKWIQKSDTATKSDHRNPYLLDALVIVSNAEGEVLAITDRFMDLETVVTPAFVVSANQTIHLSIVSLGVTSPLRLDQNPERIPLKNEKSITKQFKMTLMNLFEIFDFDGDGLLSMEEYNIFLHFSKDEPIKEEDWISLEQLVEFRHGMMTMTGFVQTFQLEMSSEERDMLEDVWTSLKSLGYDNNLKMVYGCGYEVVYYVDKPVCITCDSLFIDREYRDYVLQLLYKKGTVDESCDLRPRTYRTAYFGVTIVDRLLSIEMARYRIIWEDEPEVIWHFPNGETGIRPGEAQNEWFMMLSYQSTNPDHHAKFRIERE